MGISSPAPKWDVWDFQILCKRFRAQPLVRLWLRSFKSVVPTAGGTPMTGQSFVAPIIEGMRLMKQHNQMQAEHVKKNPS
jgi:hypothetical protein